MLKLLLALTIIASTQASQAMDVPVLRQKPYASLAFPPQLPKPTLTQLLNETAQKLHGVAFENMGDMSDWMHGHVLFKPTDKQTEPPYPLTDQSWQPDWSKLEMTGILFHTQEYDHLRGGVPYTGPNGPLDTYDRNWLLILTDAAQSLTDRLVRAWPWMETPDSKRPFTIRSDDLKKSVFGAKPGVWEFSVYFFRVNCENLDRITDAQELKDSNLIEVQLANDRICLAVENFLCRNYSETDNRCQQGEKLTYQGFGK